MTSLSEARNWYEESRGSLELFSRFLRRHWEQLPENSTLWRDDDFKTLDPTASIASINDGLEHLDDLAILFMFAAFEAMVRQHLRIELEGERAKVQHPLLETLVEDAIEQFDKGEFKGVLDLFKAQDVDLVELVQQVREYRNWVAHGRRADRRPLNLTPDQAYQRLDRFLLSFLPPSSN